VSGTSTGVGFFDYQFEGKRNAGTNYAAKLYEFQFETTFAALFPMPVLQMLIKFIKISIGEEDTAVKSVDITIMG